MQVVTRDNEIKGTRLEVTVQQVDIMQAARRINNELDILRVQGIEYLLEERFDKKFCLVLDSIQEFRIRLKNLRVAIRGVANIVVPSIHVLATLTLARHAIGWSEKNIERQLREAKA
jgi:hypothetical protein